jgi:IS5 family transposase
MKRKLMTFADIEAEARLNNVDHVLLKIDKIIDWEAFNQVLSPTDYRKNNKYGPDSYDPLVIFRIMLVQRIYNFSDREVEDHMRYNLLFMKFCRLHFNSSIPDHSTLSRWRDRFIKYNINQLLFDEFNSQLTKKGFELRNASIIDATLTEAYSRPRNKSEIVIEPIGDEEHIDSAPGEKSTIKNESPKTVIVNETSKDPDARWLKKGKKYYYGFKEHCTVNLDGILTSVITTAANIADCTMLEICITKANPKEGAIVFADKGYPSESNFTFLNNKNLSDGIMRKKKKDELDDCYRIYRNKSISKIRYIIERTFGSLKQKYGYRRTPYVGLEKTHNYALFGALTFNMVRSINLFTG